MYMCAAEKVAEEKFSGEPSVRTGGAHCETRQQTRPQKQGYLACGLVWLVALFFEQTRPQTRPQKQGHKQGHKSLSGTGYCRHRAHVIILSHVSPSRKH